MQEDRAVIVFFRDVAQVNDFMQSSYYSKLGNRSLAFAVVQWMLHGIFHKFGIHVHPNSIDFLPAATFVVWSGFEGSKQEF